MVALEGALLDCLPPLLASGFGTAALHIAISVELCWCMGDSAGSGLDCCVGVLRA